MRRILSLLLGAFLAGCAGGAPRPAPADLPALKIEAAGVLGGPATEGGLAPEDLGGAVERLLRENRRGSADRLVRRHPDAAWALLASGRVSAGRSAVAWFHDRHASLQGPASGWSALLEDRMVHPDRYRRYDASRERIVRLLREGRAEEAALIGIPDVPEDGPAAPVLRVEASRLSGVANLLADRPDRAVEVLQPGVAAARAGRPYDLSQLLLLLSEARRRAGSLEEASAAWKQAVETAAGLAERADDLFDPGFWERAANLKPPEANWPSDVASVLRKRCDRTLGFLPDSEQVESALWACVGAQRLARREARAALVSFARSGLRTNAVKVAQARALVMLGEIQAARALLAPVLALESDPSVRAAEAFLGALELRLGAPERAVGFLRKATETADDWPGRADAEANLGLALLSLGQDKEGLRWLHVAQARYEAGRDWDGLVQALRNELRWAERSGRTVEAERVRKSLALLEGP